MYVQEESETLRNLNNLPGSERNELTNFVDINATEPSIFGLLKFFLYVMFLNLQ